MSEEPPRDEDPTRAYQPFGEDAGEPTRVEGAVDGTVVPPYDPDRPAGFAPGEREPEPAAENKRREWVAPAITIALLAILFGIGIGWLLFQDSGSDSDNDSTTTTSTTTSTTTTTTAVPAVVETTTTAPTTTTTAAVRSSSTVRSTTTRVVTSQPTTTAPNQTVGTEPS